MKAVFIGPPGAGKGTIAEYFSKKYCIPHVSTGDIFRSEISRGTELGILAKEYIDRGELVPDEIVINIVKNFLSRIDLSRGFILDGYPRTVAQAIELDNFVKVDVAVYVYIPVEIAIERLSNRYVCPVCNKVYNLKFNPPKNDLTCDLDGSKLLRRSDDEPEVIKERYTVYNAQSKPVVDYYRNRGLLIEVDNSISSQLSIKLLEEELIKIGVLRLKPCVEN